MVGNRRILQNEFLLMRFLIYFYLTTGKVGEVMPKHQMIKKNRRDRNKKHF